MQIKSLRIKSYRSWRIDDNTSIFQYEMSLKAGRDSNMK